MTVSILLAVTLTIIMIFGLISPAYDYKESSQNLYRSKLDSYEFMKKNGALAKLADSKKIRQDSDQSLLGLANTTSKEFSIDFKRYEPVGESGLGLWFEDVAFNNVVLWLDKLEKTYNIHVTEIVIDRQDSDGVVNVRLELQG
ncbi:MAG: general secretion pathway protein M [Gammaproteobacteria bacterium]